MTKAGACNRASNAGSAATAPVHGYEAGPGLLHDQPSAHYHLAVGVHDDEVGLAERLPGDDEQLAALHRDVGDRRIAHHDLGGRPVQPNQRRLVDQDLDDVVAGGERRVGGAETNQRGNHR